MSENLPIIGISMGDPAGVGPEIIAKALGRPRVREICRPVVVGSADVMRAAGMIVGARLAVREIPSVDQATFAHDAMEVIPADPIPMAQVQIGKVSAAAGRAAFEAVRKVIELAMRRQIDATVTVPIHKEALALAGCPYPGHTEIFGELTGARDVAMMLAANGLRVVHVSTHVSLREACDRVTADRVYKTIELAHDACRELGIQQPKIGVAGLNPHASDGGLFGDEERVHIIPAVERARQQGMNVSGPFPPDTFFAMAIGGAWDVCVAMYHDQGHIPVKIKGFRFDATKGAWRSINGINVSLGLPIIRTSVDHGTAFDQAGHGTASDESLVEAIDYAARMARHRRNR